MYQHPDSDQYLFPSEKVFDNRSDDLKMIAVSKRLTSLLLQKETIRVDLELLKQETKPLAKIWCFKKEDDAHQPDELNNYLRVMKTYLKARYRLLDSVRAQRIDLMTNSSKKWIKKGAPDKGDLE